MPDEEIDIAALEKRMDGALSALRTEFASLRTGRASASMLDPVTVEAYGSTMPVNQLGTITVPESRMVLVNVWDKALVNAVDKAIRNSGLGINPQMDGTILRLPIIVFALDGPGGLADIVQGRGRFTIVEPG